MFQFFINKNLIGFVGICMGLGAIKLRQAQFWSRSLSPIYTWIPKVKKRPRSKVSSCLQYDGTCVCVLAVAVLVLDSYTEWSPLGRCVCGMGWSRWSTPPPPPEWGRWPAQSLRSLSLRRTRKKYWKAAERNILIKINKKLLEGCRTKHIDKNKLANIGRLWRKKLMKILMIWICWE